MFQFLFKSIGIRNKAAIADHRELFTCAQVILSLVFARKQLLLTIGSYLHVLK